MKEENEENIKVEDIHVENDKENNKENIEKEDIKENKAGEKNKKEKKSVIGIITSIVLWIILFFAVALLLSVTMLGKQEIFGHRIYIIMSGSMEPAIHVGDAVISKNVDNLEIGDVIAYRNPIEITTHRIIKVYTEEDKKMYKTKGDNNGTEDPGLVQESQIVGKIVYRIPKLGNAILYIQSHFLIVMIIAGIIIFIIVIRRVI